MIFAIYVIVLASPSEKLAIGLALIFAVDRPLDMCRTMVNVTGDATVAMVVAKSVGKLGEPHVEEWDDKLGKFRDEPLKNWAKDPADSFRMMAVGHKDIRRLGQGVDPEEEELRLIKEKEEREKNVDPTNPFAM